MIILREIGLRRGSKLLLHNASVTIQPGQRLALIGGNGCGKSSLFSLLLGELGADTGAIEGMNKLRLSHMAQEIQVSSLPAGEYVWRGDQQLARKRDELRRLEADPGYLQQVLSNGAERAAAIADPVVAEVKEIVGFLP